MKVFVLDEKGPGQTMTVRGPNGETVGTVVPPCSQWCFQNCGGEPRPFFLITPVEAASAAPRAPRLREPRRVAPVPSERSSANAGRRASFQGGTSGMVCQCLLS